ncbi:response regulator [Nitrosopumilus ureiphilus]|uniref:Response regulator n=1 Tax=Nitrosopumilus ureiphilus TaxID=1470067 RepID=A0A7D5RF79_9ARCH|nr:response regulator [Nitrosopumilus ureiphilus]QLH07961.1 response regulator [Nitrosopumilus ureiphilus]
MTNVIVIDDDFDTMEVFSEFLMLRGIEVIGKGENGLEGVILYEEKHPDIVFSDMWMPEYDGFYLLSTLKNAYPDSKVIMVTADLTQETNRKLKELNADGVIFKPFKIEHIMGAINKVSNNDKQIVSCRL